MNDKKTEIYEKLLVLCGMATELDRLGVDVRDLTTDEQSEKMVELTKLYTGIPQEDVTTDMKRILVDKITEVLALDATD
jgi:hypothetical protein